MLFEKNNTLILPLVSLLKVFSLYKIKAFVHLGLPSLWFVGAVLRHSTRYLLTAILSLPQLCMNTSGLCFSACALLSTSCSLCKRVCPINWQVPVILFGSSFVSMSMEPVSETRNSWLSVELIHRCLDWLQGGIASHPFFQCCLGGMNDSSSRAWKFLGVRMLTSSSLITFPKWLGKLEGQMLRQELKHSLGGLLHRTRASRGACCSLHKALVQHLILSCTALESDYSLLLRVSPDLSLKNQQTLCWDFLLDKEKTITFFLVQQAHKSRDFARNPVLMMWG